MKLKYFILGSVSAATVMAVLSLVIFKEQRSAEKESLVEVLMGGVRDDLELWDLTRPHSSKEVDKKIAESILLSLMIVRMASLNVDRMKRSALEGFCLISKRDDILDHVENEMLVQVGKEYLSSVAPEVIDRIKESQKELRGNGCYLSPR